MSSQNHGYALTKESAPEGVEITHINLNDQTVAGLKSESQKCFSVQFHPESHPGPHEADYLFDEFLNLVKSQTKTSKPVEASRAF
jgi:carbamoyl-phosphate synthase small subunit